MRVWCVCRAVWALLGAIVCVSASFAAGGELLLHGDGEDLYAQAMRALSENRLSEARSALAVLIAQEPGTPGEWLDLATLHCSLGDSFEAERLFTEIESRFFPPEAIRQIISLQRAQGCSRPRKPSSVMLRLGRGYDKNANQGASNPYFSIGSGADRLDLVLLPAYLPHSDHFSALSLDAVFPQVFDGAADGFFQIRTRKYDNLSQVDSLSAMAGLERSWRVGGWDMRGGGSVTATSLGGKHYLNQGSLQLQAQPPLELPKGWEFWGFTTAAVQRYPSFSEFDGNLFELGIGGRYSTVRSMFSMNAGVSVDHAVRDRPGRNRSGGFVGAEGKFLLYSDWIGELTAFRQFWHSSDPYSPGVIDVRRRQNTTFFKVGVAIPWDAAQSVHIDYLYSNNAENISLFDYSGYVVQVSWQYRFGR